MDADRFYIGGEWVAPSGDATMPIMDPSMDEQVGTVAHRLPVRMRVHAHANDCVFA
jgi:acyl-CoA reductase-like NAD-dependent aldehyde dehydrogenase